MNLRKNNRLWGSFSQFFGEYLEAACWQSQPSQHVGEGKAGTEGTRHISKPGTRTRVTDLTTLTPLALAEIRSHFAFRLQSKRSRRRKMKQQKTSIVLTVKIPGSYLVLVALHISDGETQVLKKLVRPWSNETQNAVKTNKKKELHSYARKVRACQLQSFLLKTKIYQGVLVLQ